MSNILSYHAKFGKNPATETIALANACIAKYNEHPDIATLVNDHGGSLFSEIQIDQKLDQPVLSGELKLPVDLLAVDAYDFSYVMENWLGLLSELKMIFVGSSWNIQIDGTSFPWDSEKNQFKIPN